MKVKFFVRLPIFACFFALVCLLQACGRATVNNSELDGDNISIESYGSVQVFFEFSGQDFVDGQFVVSPGKASITVKLVEGSVNDAEILLFDEEYEDAILCSHISQNKKVRFDNLLGNHNYWFRIVSPEAGDAGKDGNIVLRISS